jgi:hypothetical protein
MYLTNAGKLSFFIPFSSPLDPSLENVLIFILIIIIIIFVTTVSHIAYLFSVETAYNPRELMQQASITELMWLVSSLHNLFRVSVRSG